MADTTTTRPATPGQPLDERPGTAAKRLPADHRRQQLVDVALVVFAERGFNATTMDDIAERAGVTKPLLYQHFESKRALYLELLSSVSRTLLDSIHAATSTATGPRQQVEGGFAAYFQLVVEQADAFQLLFASDVPNDPELSRALRRVEDVLAEAVDPLIDAGLDEDHRRLLAYAVVGMAEGASHYFLSERAKARETSVPAPQSPLEVERLARRLGDLAWAGLRSVHPED